MCGLGFSLKINAELMWAALPRTPQQHAELGLQAAFHLHPKIRAVKKFLVCFSAHVFLRDHSWRFQRNRKQPPILLLLRLVIPSYKASLQTTSIKIARVTAGHCKAASLPSPRTFTNRSQTHTDCFQLLSKTQCSLISSPFSLLIKQLPLENHPLIIIKNMLTPFLQDMDMFRKHTKTVGGFEELGAPRRYPCWGTRDV